MELTIQDINWYSNLPFIGMFVLFQTTWTSRKTLPEPINPLQTELYWWNMKYIFAFLPSFANTKLKHVQHFVKPGDTCLVMPGQGNAMPCIVLPRFALFVWTKHHYSDLIMSAMASQITGVSILCSTVCSGADQIKHQSSTSLSFVRGIHRWPVDSPPKRPVKRKILALDDIIMINHSHFDW